MKKTIAYRHHKIGFHQISAWNSKVRNTRHVWYWHRTYLVFSSSSWENQFNTQNSIKSTRNDLKLCREDHDQIGRLLLEEHRPRPSNSTGNQKGVKNTNLQTLKDDSTRSTILWGIGWFSLVEMLNSHHRSNQHNKNGLKRYQNKESSLQRKGTKGSPWRTRWTQNLIFQTWIPKDTRWLGPPFPLPKWVHTQFSQIVDLSLTRTLRGGEKLKDDQKERSRRGEMVWRPPSLIYRPITHFAFALRYFESNHLT